MPWHETEEKYSKLFVEKNGRPAIPVQVALGALNLKEKMKSSDEELAELIRERPYLQFFLWYEEYKYEIPFDPSMMVHFWKQLSGNILKEVNALIIEKSKQKYEKKARKEFLTFIRSRKPRVNTIKKAVRTQVQYVERNYR
jgi:hypothetical protein